MRLVAMIFPVLCYGQGALMLPEVFERSGSTVYLSLDYKAGSVPATGLQFTLTYPASLPPLAITVGQAAASPGKAFTCGEPLTLDSQTSAVVCLLAPFLNNSAIRDGEAAKITVTIPDNFVGIANVGILSSVLPGRGHGGTLGITVDQKELSITVYPGSIHVLSKSGDG